jgi:hypothetical protein
VRTWNRGWVQMQNGRTNLVRKNSLQLCLQFKFPLLILIITLTPDTKPISTVFFTSKLEKIRWQRPILHHEFAPRGEFRPMGGTWHQGANFDPLGWTLFDLQKIGGVNRGSISPLKAYFTPGGGNLAPRGDIKN